MYPLCLMLEGSINKTSKNTNLGEDLIQWVILSGRPPQYVCQASNAVFEEVTPKEGVSDKQVPYCNDHTQTFTEQEATGVYPVCVQSLDEVLHRRSDL